MEGAQGEVARDLKIRDAERTVAVNLQRGSEGEDRNVGAVDQSGVPRAIDVGGVYRSAAKTIPIEFPELTPARNWFVIPSDNR